MASMGSFSTGVDSSILVHSANHHRPMTPIPAFTPTKYVAFAGTAECNSVGFSSNTAVDLFSRVSVCTGCGGRRRRWNTQHVKATTEGSGTGDEAEEALQAAIENSKKIAERRNIVSSIRNSISDSEQPYKESKVTVANLDAAEEIQDAAEPGKDLSGNVTPFAASTCNQSNEVPPAPLKSSTGPSVEPSSYDNVSKELKNTKEVVISALKTSAEEDSKKKSKETTVGAATLLYKPSRKEEDSDNMFKDSTIMTTILPDKQSTKEEQQRDNVKAPNLEDANVEVQDPTNEDVKPPPLAGVNVMNVIIVAFECAPWIKTGGLGDVAGALPKALARRGHRVMVVVPRYGNYAEAQDSGVRKRYKVDGQDFEVNYFHTYIEGVDFVFIDSPPFRHIQNNIYGGNHLDVLKRMILFCKAAVEVPWHVPCGGACYGDGNLAFIANDWHTALLPVYLKAYYRDNGLMKYARSVLVIHNIAHQGRGPLDDFNYVDLPPHYLDLFKLYDPVGGDHLNIFAAGLKAADRIVTVSHGYAWELKTSEGGWGLHGVINENDWKFRGIVNGIDTNDWSPELDVHLQSDGYVNYSLETLQTGKPQCKASLQRELRLPVRQDVPLIGFIGRLDNQKGVDLIAEAVPWMMGQDVQLVMLGTGRPDLEELLRKFEGEYNDKARGWVGFSVKVAHRITAGADIILMPSRFEPCGLNQLYAMRYGTIPVVHAVGGLRDTVEPFNPFEETGLGWTFNRAETNELVNALGNCLLTYRQYKESWVGLQRRGMSQDLSWDNAAQSYEDVLVAAKYQW